MSKKLTALEALRLLYTHEDLANRDVVAYLLEEEHLAEYYNIIEKELKRLEKQNKALKIIKRCPYEVTELIDIYDTWEEYRDDHYAKDRLIKNKEEFELLKEVLL